MVFKQKLLLVLVSLFFLMLTACHQAKYVPSGKYLYTIKPKKRFRAAESSTIHFLVIKDSVPELMGAHNQIVTEDLYEILKPQPNRTFNLFVYNRIDTLKMQRQIEKKAEKVLAKNNRRINRQNEINRKRNDRAKAKGSTHFFEKNIKLKKRKYGWRHWISNNIGEPPVLMDSTKVSKSAEQMRLYLKKHGFYESTISDSIVYNDKRKKAYPIYRISPGRPVKVKSLEFDSDPKYSGLKYQYLRMLKKKDSLIYIGDC